MNTGLDKGDGTLNKHLISCRHALWAVLWLIAVQLVNWQDACADTIIELGIHGGGDELINEPYTNGAQDSIKAGGMFSFAFGRLYQVNPSWETQLTFGVKSDAKYDQDIKVSWVRYPLNYLIFYRMSDVRVGLGATYHFSPKLKGSGLADNIGEKYKGAMGALLEIDFIHSYKFLLGMRLTLIDYQSKHDGHVVDGNSIGFLIIAQL